MRIVQRLQQQRLWLQVIHSLIHSLVGADFPDAMDANAPRKKFIECVEPIRRIRFRIDLGPLRGSSSPLRRFWAGKG